MLKDILHKKQCFKLICGAGNENVSEIEKLVALYAKAGANFFDLAAKEEIINAALRGLNRVIPENNLKNYHLCVSIGTKDDPHIRKAFIDEFKCASCGKCLKSCHNKAIKKNHVINSAHCTGCGNCGAVCPNNAISFYYQNKPIEEILPILTRPEISCIELHGNNEDEIYEKWNILNNNFKGILSISINRNNFGNIKLLSILKTLLKDRQDFTTIIQADGNPMSGTNDEYKTTLQAVAMAEIVQNANLSAFIILSGGTNSKTAKLAQLCGINAHGTAIGSFARKIVRDYIDKEDFFENQDIFNEALKIAKKLVEKALHF